MKEKAFLRPDKRVKVGYTSLMGNSAADQSSWCGRGCGGRICSIFQVSLSVESFCFITDTKARFHWVCVGDYGERGRRPASQMGALLGTELLSQLRGPGCVSLDEFIQSDISFKLLQN